MLIIKAEKPSVTRAERSANAAKEVSSLPRAATPRGIDARSLAAKPPQGISIRRVGARVRMDEAPPSGASGQRGRGARPRGGAASRGKPVARAGRGGRPRAGRSRGKGKGRGRGMPKAGSEKDVEDVEPPLEKEEAAWFDGFESGFEIPYNPTTNLEYLKKSGASVMPPSSQMGVVESVAHRFQIATSMVSAPDTHSAIHLERIKRGDGSIFESPEAKAVAQDYYDQFRQADADKLADREGRERKKVEPRPLPTLDALPENIRSELAKVLVAGHYTAPKHADKGDVLGLVETYAKLNETYLPHSKKSFEEKLRSLLPAAYQKQQVGNAQMQRKVQKPL